MLCSQCDNANHNTIVTKLHYALNMRLHSKKRRHRKNMEIQSKTKLVQDLDFKERPPR